MGLLQDPWGTVNSIVSNPVRAVSNAVRAVTSTPIRQAVRLSKGADKAAVKAAHQLGRLVVPGAGFPGGQAARTLPSALPSAPTLPTVNFSFVRGKRGQGRRRGGTILTSGRGVIAGVAQGNTLLGQ